MPRKKKKQNEYKQLDIDSALKGKEKYIKQKDESVYTEKSSSTFSPFDFVTDIRGSKSGRLMDSESGAKSFNKFMVLRVLSMNKLDIDLCNILNQYQNIIPPESLYQALVGLIEKDRTFYKYIKSNNKVKNSENVSFVADYYEVPEYQAEVFIQLLGEEWASELRKKYGGDSFVS